MSLTLPSVDRRTLLIGGGAGIGLIAAYALWPRGHSSALRPGEGEALFDHWIRIGPDSRVTVAVPQVETGQGIWTGFAQIVADELGADWDQVAVEPATPSAAYANPLADAEGWTAGGLFGGSGQFQVTAGSTSIRAFDPILRAAAAAARTQLIKVAARQWDVDPAECDAIGGAIVHDGKTVPFGRIAIQAAGEELPSRSSLRKGKLIGEPLPRLDLPGKINGSARFAADVRLPQMLFASIRIAPHGGRLVGFNRAAAEAVSTTIRIVVRENWLAVAGATWWEAQQALAAARPRFTGRVDATTDLIRSRLDDALEQGEATSIAEAGDVSQLLNRTSPVTATYRIAPAIHHGLETLTATARFTGDRLEVWAPSQAPAIARAAAANAAGFGEEQVVFYPMPVGGGAGRALEADAVPFAVEIAAELGRPVQLNFPVSESQHHERLRQPALARMAGIVGPQGRIAAWSARIASTAGESGAFARLSGRAVSTSYSPSDLAGAVPSYGIDALGVEAVVTALPIMTGYMRGGSHALTGFFNESFVDELARSVGAEPLGFRMGMLGSNVRLARAIARAAALGGWDGGGNGSTMGLACHSAFGSHIGLLAQAAIGSDQRIAVSRLVAVVDCGRIINRNLVRQQIEGGLLEALASATAARPSFVAGVPVARDIGAMNLPRMADTPQIDVEMIDSDEAPGGVSGLAHPVLAPAIANAIHAGSGRRLRQLPFDLSAA